MILFERDKTPGMIYIHPQEDSAVQIAAANLAADVEKVCGVHPVVTHEWTEDVRIAVGTLGRIALPPSIKVQAVNNAQGSPRWEGYIQQMHHGLLYLVGNDRRGAVYAVYDLCERMGVSPWYDMADVPVKTKNVIELADDWFLADWPSVQYRGIFLNDEEELDYWARTMNGEDTIGPKTYERIFELILRLKGNYIWPAMHVNAFNINEENGRLAQRMGVVTGTSHCDMLHRSNQNEWKHWLKQTGYADVRYDYTIPGENRERLLEYWRGSLEQHKKNECCYTIGMRGIHDSGFVTANLEGGESLTEDEVMQRKRALLEEIMTAQRGLISEVHPGEQIPQAFVPYKEVLPIYDSGLKVPEDVTLIWVDDNHGYMRRYPNAQEQQRSGGHGVYYHSSYWAPPGMSWLFICSTPLAHMGNELKKCYEQNIRRIWVDNVGALKPIEQDMEYFLRCGWDAGRTDSVMLDAKRFTREWINRNFSGNHGKEAAEIYTAFTQLSNLCKPEHMRSDVFSQTAYGDEAAARLQAMHALVVRCETIWKALPENEQDAFFQLLLMKMQAAFYIAASYYYADRSRIMYKIGAMRAADANMEKSREMDDLKRLMLHYYNEVMCGGKWNGILTPEDFPPPPLELYPACKPALKYGKGSLILRLPGEGHEYCLHFDCLGAKKQWFELLNTGAGDIPYVITADQGIFLSCAEGTLEAEKRVLVSVSECFVQGQIIISTADQQLTVSVCQSCGRLPVSSLHEADGVVHLPAEACGEQEGFRLICDIGRGCGNAMEACAEAAPEHPAWLKFTFETFTEGPAEVEIIRFLTLNSTGDLRVRITLDDGEPQVIAFTAKDEYVGNWTEAAVRCGDKGSVFVPVLRTGKHVLRIEALDGYMTLCACNIYLRPRQECVLGPGVLDGYTELPEYDTHAMAAQYSARMEEVPLPWVSYVGDEFWQQDMLYARVERYRPAHRGAVINWYDAGGSKDIHARLNAAVICEKDGHLCWEAENALMQSCGAWMTPGVDGSLWTHRQAETNGRTGLAMWLEPAPVEQQIALPGPTMNYRICCEQETDYHIWMLVKYDDERHFRCSFAMDGINVRETAKVCRNHFHTYRTVYTWCWQKLITMPVTKGEHVFSITAETTGMAIDRIYMTTGNEYPPMDDEWTC